MTTLTPNSIFLAGVPAAGKTYFGNWLAKNKGYLHLDFEKSESADAAEVRKEWDEFFATGKELPLIQALASKNVPIVFNWGFVPNAHSFIKHLLTYGMAPVWFAASKSHAEGEFVKRGGIPVEAFNTQMQKIAQYQQELGDLFQSCVIFTIDKEGNRVSPEVIYERIVEAYKFTAS